MKKINIIITILITLLIGCLTFYIGLNIKAFQNPKDVYMVYLDGKKIGLIENKQLLLDKINEEQRDIKSKYNVDEVYPPNGLQIVNYTSYHDNYVTIGEIYNQISEFSVKGYIATIERASEDVESGEESIKYVYVLNKEDLIKALDKIVSIFVPEEQYNKYLTNKQDTITDVGEYIQLVYLKEKVTIKEGYINTSNDILTSYDEITQYLLYGTLDNEKSYTVKKGDTIESIAYDNGLSTEELIIANPELKNENVLLSGNGDQKVNVLKLSPLVSIIYESDLVEEQVDSYNTIVQYDDQMETGTSYTKQNGENGIIKVKFKMQYENGEIYQAIKVESTELTPSIDKIIVRGGKKSTGSGVGNSTIWYWPTIKPYKISSGWGYRNLAVSSRYSNFHDAVDITGCGYGSPVYAANDGVVYYAGTQSDGAVTIRVDHQNGYYTYYVHLKEIYVKTGQTVRMGDKIAAMGNTGYVLPKPTAANPTAGTHLHFAVYYSSDNGVSRKSINPLKLNYQ